MQGPRASQERLLAGSAQLSITPPLGVSMAGYYHDRRADDILDDLSAKALVLSMGSTTVALVVCDLIGLERESATRARTLIEQRTGISPSHVMISCTHTHTGPVTVNRITLHLQPDDAYLDVLTRKIADVVQLAFQRRVAASVEVGQGRVQGIAFNRRYWMKDGTLRTNPPFQSPEIDRPAGPIDPELGILLVRDAYGSPLALVTNYALHADEVGGTAFCADYQGVESRILAGVLGESCVVLCPNGCCGDINHFDMSRPGSEQHGMVAAERSGTTLAGEIIKQLPHLRPLTPASLYADSQSLQVPLRFPSPQDVTWAEKAAGGDLRGFDSHGLDVVRANRILAIHAQARSSISIEVSAISLGDVAFVGLPGEVFVELGLSIKGQSPFSHTFIAELCNDSIGYVPTRAAYSEGGYESTSTRLEPGTGETIASVALELLTRLSKAV